MVQAAAHREESLNKEIQGLLENAIRFEVDAKLSTNRSAALSAEVSRQRVLISEGHEALTSLKV